MIWIDTARSMAIVHSRMYECMGALEYGMAPKKRNNHDGIAVMTPRNKKPTHLISLEVAFSSTGTALQGPFAFPLVLCEELRFQRRCPRPPTCRPSSASAGEPAPAQRSSTMTMAAKRDCAAICLLTCGTPLEVLRLLFGGLPIARS